MSQTERILFIDRQLRSTGRITVNEVALQFEVSTRQVKRDIEYLRDRFSAPIIWDSQNRFYKYDRIFRALEFADQRLVMSYIALKSMATNNQYVPVYSDEIISTIENDVPRDYKAVCDKITYQIPQAETINPDFFMDICTALRDHRCLLIEYQDVKGDITERKIEPEHLINYSGLWYLVCYDYLRNDLRTFHLSRIQKLRLTNIPTENNGADYIERVNKVLSDGFGIFKGYQTVTTVIRFYNEAARIIENQCWHNSQKITKGIEIDSNKKERKYTQLELPVANLTEILFKILSFGSNAIPLEPKQLRQNWKEEIQKLSSLTQNKEI